MLIPKHIFQPTTLDKNMTKFSAIVKSPQQNFQPLKKPTTNFYIVSSYIKVDPIFGNEMLDLG